jgi:hypothetical protein
MKPLAATEALFQDHVLTGDLAIESQIEGDSADFRNIRLGIYRDAYRLRLIEVLGTDYEVLRKYLGDALFNALARDYIDAHPSTFRNVRWFGGRLADFLGSTPRYAAHPELAELARFEWALGLAFDSPDDEPVRFEQVVAVAPADWPELRFLPHASLHVIDLSTNAVAIWKEIDERESFALETTPEPVAWAIWRKKHSPFFRSLGSDEAWALRALLARAGFGEICAGLCEWVDEEDAAPRAAGMLRSWVEEGWITELLIGAQRFSGDPVRSSSPHRE